jgi:hypothetical protein
VVDLASGGLVPPVNQARCSNNYLSALSILSIFMKQTTYWPGVIGFHKRGDMAEQAKMAR